MNEIGTGGLKEPDAFSQDSAVNKVLSSAETNSDGMMNLSVFTFNETGCAAHRFRLVGSRLLHNLR